MEDQETQPPLWRLVWHEVRQDFIPLRASALAFQTLASWLPLLAIALAILSGTAFEKQREHVIDSLATALVPPVAAARFTPNGEVAQSQAETQFKQKLRDTIHLMQAKLRTISTLSFLVLLVIAGMLYRTAEETFNAIWKVRSGRSIFMKIAIVTVFVFWGPVFFFLSLSLTESASASVLGRWIVPTLLMAFAFTAFYMIMPNARVRFSAALAGGIFGAILWELGKQAFLVYVSYAVGLSKFYGSLGLVPIVFLWVFVSWVMILAGAELAYIIQHHRAMSERWLARKREELGLAVAVDEAQREASYMPAMALAAACEVTRLFRSRTKTGGARLTELAENLGVEAGPLGRALDRLVEGGLLVQVASDRVQLSAPDPRYIPARDPTQCNMNQVLSVCKGTAVPECSGAVWERVRTLLARVDKEGLPAVEDLMLADLAEDQPSKSKKEASETSSAEDAGRTATAT
jgi:YihY family inner membrane protein